MERRKTLFLLILIGLIITLLVIINYRTHKWISSLVNDPVCRPPCWEGITPGIVDIEYAEKLLRQDKKVQIRALKVDYILWEIQGDSGQIFADFPGSNIVTRMTYQLNGSNLSLKHILDIYGKPSMIQVGDCRDKCSTYLFYDNLNMIVGIYSWQIEDGKVDLTTSSEITRLIFYSTEFAPYPEDSLFTWQQSEKMIWKGLGIYP